MQKWALICWALLTLAGADECPGGTCKEEVVATVQCKDGKFECPDATTCCLNPEGGWSCCPLPQAVCCSDKTHCCPADSTCDVEHTSCISSATKRAMPMWEKLPARRRAEWENQKDGEQLSTLAGDLVTVEKVPELTTDDALPLSAAAGNYVQCNSTAACPDGSTCCRKKDDTWACCPLPEAVCCADFHHCCPHGKTCNLPEQKCDGSLESVPWVQKVPAVHRQDVQAEEVLCDKVTVCPADTTCCKTKDEEWECCPLPEAVCCDDHADCCPSGTTCDVATSSCNGPNGATPMRRKIPARATVTTATRSEQEKEEEEKEKDTRVEVRIQCDPTTTCPQGTTCCYMKDAQTWGCCPLPEAVCCVNGMNCCPGHYKCDEQGMHCIKEDVRIPSYAKLPAATSVSSDAGVVQCDSSTSCPDGTTCCKIATGAWGCCPLVQAVCCSDMIHCCPSGYTCDQGGECIQNADWLWHVFLTNTKKRLIV